MEDFRKLYYEERMKYCELANECSGYLKRIAELQQKLAVILHKEAKEKLNDIHNEE